MKLSATWLYRCAMDWIIDNKITEKKVLKSKMFWEYLSDEINRRVDND